MTYQEFIEIVFRSSARDWKDAGVMPGTNHRTLVHRGNIEVRLEVGRPCTDAFAEPHWAAKFKKNTAQSIYVDMYLGGAFVRSDILVSVDGGRCALPMPSVPEMTVSVNGAKLARLVHDGFGNENDFDEIMAIAGITVL
jgi:hypothetical protein